MDSFTSADEKQAREAAYAAVNQLKTESTSVVEYQSRGHLVIIGNAETISSFGKIPDNLTSETISYQGLPPHKDISIKGALGQFVITVADQSLKADLIIDLTPDSILTMDLKPPGYFVCDLSKSETDISAIGISAIKEELADLVGTFEKPRYFDYNESACAHGRSGKKGCTRCLDACPAGAITPLINSIKVDPYRCQGGGICATVCPSSAITYAYPKPKDLLTQIRLLILTYLKEGGASPDLVFVTEAEQQRAGYTLPSALVITVEEVASVGAEAWLSALAWGARSVRLFDLDGMPKSALIALDLHLEMVQRILVAIGYPPHAVSRVADTNELITNTFMPDIETSSHIALAEKRQSFYMALDHLVASSEKVKPLTLLPTGSIFGETLVDQTRCTLCMACVSACPGNALQDGNEKPQLSFVEANCLQCGICTSTCPEDAITLTPRLLLDHEARRKPRTLHEESPFCCISCGKPFATTSGITTILSKLSGHSMFADERSMNRLKMCSDCRVVDMMEDPATDL